MPDYYNDGNIPFGSIVVTIGGVTGVAEDLEVEQPSTSIVRRNEINVPNGAVHIKDLIKVTMTLQLASVSTAVPTRFSIATFSLGGVSKSYILTKVGQPVKQDDIRKVKLELTEKLN
jgi:hypothetical protein